MNITRRVFLASGAAMAAVAAGEFGNMNRASAQRNRVVNLYSARHYDTDTRIYDSFTQKTGIKVNLIEAEADKLIERIKSEGANSPADLFITVDAGRLWRAQNEDILQPISSKALIATVPSYLRSPGGYWFGLSKRARVIVYNKDKVKPAELSTYEDLTDGKWKGRLLTRSSTSIYNQSLTGSMLAAHGEQDTEKWAKGIVANLARQPEGNDTAQIKAVAAGVGDLTFVNTYYVARILKSDKPEDKAIASKIGVFFPNQNDRGTHINISGGGVVKTAPNRDAAIQFLEHLASKESQEIFAGSNNEYPVLEGVATDSVVVSFADYLPGKKFKEDNLNAAEIGRLNGDALKVMDRAGWK